MTTFTITTDSIAVVKAIMKNVEGLDDIKVTTEQVSPSAPQSVPTDETPVSSPTSAPAIEIGQVQTLLDKLVDEHVDGGEKPYRVLKSDTLENLINTKGITTSTLADGEDIDTSVTLDDVKAALSFIIRDISDGGMNRAQMRNIFDAGNSFEIFENFGVYTIVKYLKRENLI